MQPIDSSILLSIVFITMNRKNELIRAIDSCLNCLPEKSEIIIVDNGSTDGTPDIIKEYMENHSVDIKYYYQLTNLGVAGGRNVAFKEAKGIYVFFLDDDAAIGSENFWQKLIRYMDEHDGVVAVSVDIQEPKKGTNLNSKYVYKKNNISEIPTYCGCAHMLRRSFYARFNKLYPDKLMFGSEELYSSFLAWKENKKVAEYKEISVNHFPSNINRHAGKERDIDLIINQYLIKKLMCPILVLPITYFMFVLHCIHNGFWKDKWRDLIRERIDNRYEKGDINRMRLSTWIKIIYKFGWQFA